jgi:hypothetical protein
LPVGARGVWVLYTTSETQVSLYDTFGR